MMHATAQKKATNLTTLFMTMGYVLNTIPQIETQQLAASTDVDIKRYERT